MFTHKCWDFFPHTKTRSVIYLQPNTIDTEQIFHLTTLFDFPVFHVFTSIVEVEKYTPSMYEMDAIYIRLPGYDDETKFML